MTQNKGRQYGYCAVLAGSVLVLTLWAGPAWAQPSGISTQLPAINTLSASSPDPSGLEAEIDGLIQEQTGTIMSGLQGYGVNVGRAIQEKIMDEIMRSIAGATVYAPIAEKILTAYQQQKNQSLARELRAVRAAQQAGLDNQLKIQYQALKLAYQKARANAVEPGLFSRSKTEQVAGAVTSGLYPQYAGVLDEFYTSPARHAMLREDNPYLAYYLIGTAATLAGTDALNAKMALAKRSYQPGSRTGEVTQTSAYDRIRLKQEVRDQALRQQAGLSTLRAITRATILNKQRKRQRSRYSQSMHLPSRHL